MVFSFSAPRNSSSSRWRDDSVLAGTSIGFDVDVDDVLCLESDGG